MANIKSIGGNPIVVGIDGIQDGSITTAKLADGAVTDAKLVQTGGVLDRVLLLGENFEIFNETFIRGGIANDGSINSETYRIVTQNILQYGYPLFIKLANSDYRFMIAFYESDSDTLRYMTGYGQSQQLIEEGARFRISIAKVNETATPADVTVFRNSVVKETEHYIDYLRVSSQENTEVLDKYIQQRWQNKNYDSTSGAFVYGGYRAIAQPLTYPFDIVVTNNDSTLYHFNIKYWSDTPAIAANYIQSSGWTDDSYTIKKDTYFTIEYTRKLNSTPLPSNADMASLISFTTVGLPYDLALDAINCEVHETSGYYNSNGYIWPADSTYQEVYTQLYPMSTEIAYEISLKFSSRQAIVGMYALFDKSKKFVGRPYFSNEMGYEKQSTITTENADIAYVAFSYRTYGDVSVKLTCQSIGKALTRGLASLDDAVSLDAHFVNPNVSSINHRGYNTEAPENTLPAYRMSRRKGFKMVECDVSFTSDGVAVLLHDSTINRTARNADGTALTEPIPISSLTYEEALSYDFGLWKGQRWAGTKIPTLAEFIVLCRNIGLYPYIEIKEAGLSQANVNTIVDIVRNCGMAQKVTWVSSSSTALGYVLAKNPKARVGFIANSVDSSVIETAQSLMNGENDVFINSGGYTDAQVELCQNAGIPLEVWNFATTDAIAGLPAYVSGITSDNLVAGYVLYQSNIND